MLSALAAVTERVGLIATGSTTYSKPWDLARRFATLDHLSAGRAGWNIVTTISSLTAGAFGEAAHPDRYARADEFVELATRLWDSWDADAVVGDRQNGVWADRAKIHTTSFHGEYHDLDGMLPFPARRRAVRCSSNLVNPRLESHSPAATPTSSFSARPRWPPRSLSGPAYARQPRRRPRS